jgi:hypothetical protein
MTTSIFVNISATGTPTGISGSELGPMSSGNNAVYAQWSNASGNTNINFQAVNGTTWQLSFATDKVTFYSPDTNHYMVGPYKSGPAAGALLMVFSAKDGNAYIYMGDSKGLPDTPSNAKPLAYLNIDPNTTVFATAQLVTGGRMNLDIFGIATASSLCCLGIGTPSLCKPLTGWPATASPACDTATSQGCAVAGDMLPACACVDGSLGPFNPCFTSGCKDGSAYVPTYYSGHACAKNLAIAIAVFILLALLVGGGVYLYRKRRGY